MLFEVVTGRPIGILKGHLRSVQSVATAGRWIVTASDDTTALVWDIEAILKAVMVEKMNAIPSALPRRRLVVTNSL